MLSGCVSDLFAFFREQEENHKEAQGKKHKAH